MISACASRARLRSSSSSTVVCRAVLKRNRSGRELLGRCCCSQGHSCVSSTTRFLGGGPRMAFLYRSGSVLTTKYLSYVSKYVENNCRRWNFRTWAFVACKINISLFHLLKLSKTAASSSLWCGKSTLCRGLTFTAEDAEALLKHQVCM